MNLARRQLRQRSPLDDALYVLAPVFTLVELIIVRHSFAVDFEHAYWVAGQRLLHGASPYAWTHAQIASAVNAFPYPALPAIVFVPFALLPKTVAASIWVALQMGSVAVTLRVLQVRDRRLYALAFLWWPVIIGWQTGNMTLLLGLGLALVWRHRNRPLVAGLLTAVMISLKPFVWPIGLWLLATRRWRAAGWAVATGAALNLAAWAIVGFGQVRPYIHLASEVTDALYRDGYGVIAIAVRLGAGRTAGTAALVVLAAALAVACIWFGRRRREAAALLIAVDLMLVASPLLWNHYFELLIVPFAILRPRASREWLLALIVWLCPGGLQETTWETLLFAVAVVAVTWLLLRRRSPLDEQRPIAISDERRAGQAYVLATAQGGERAG